MDSILRVFKKKETILLLIYCSGLAILPLIYWPWSTPVYEIPRVVFIHRWIELLLFTAILFRVPFSNTISWRSIVMLVGFFLIALLASVLGADFPKSIWGNYFRGDGLMTLSHCIGLSLFTASYIKCSWFHYIIRSIGFGAAFTSFLAVEYAVRIFLLHDTSLDGWGNGTIGVTFGNPNLLAGYLVVAFPVIPYLYKITKNHREKVFWMVTMVSVMCATALTQSIGGIGLLILGICGWVIYSQLIKKSYMRWAVVLIMIIIGIVGLVSHTPTGFVAEGRERIFYKLLLGVSQKPLLGWGWANVDYAFEAVPWPIFLQHDIYVDKAHASVLEVFVTSGIVGLTLYILIIMTTMKRLIQNRNEYGIFLLMFVLYVSHSQMNVISIGEEVFFWMIVGVSNVMIPKKPYRSERFLSNA
jgi:O-antigen ligase